MKFDCFTLPFQCYSSTYSPKMDSFDVHHDSPLHSDHDPHRFCTLSLTSCQQRKLTHPTFHCVLFSWGNQRQIATKAFVLFVLDFSPHHPSSFLHHHHHHHHQHQHHHPSSRHHRLIAIVLKSFNADDGNCQYSYMMPLLIFLQSST